MKSELLVLKMKNFTDSIEKSLQNNNWYAALTLALTMPDICGKLETPNQHTNKRYIRWFEKYLGDFYRANIGGEEIVFLTGRDAYALRCSYLHGGEADISKQKQQEILKDFVFLTSEDPEKRGSHCNKIMDTLQLDTYTFCMDMNSGVEKWVSDNKTNPKVQDAAGKMLEIHLNGVTLYNGLVRIE